MCWLLATQRCLGTVHPTGSVTGGAMCGWLQEAPTCSWTCHAAQQNDCAYVLIVYGAHDRNGGRTAQIVAAAV